MGKNRLILNQPPEKLVLINRLHNYDKSQTWGEKLKNMFKSRSRTKAHSKSKWCRILNKSDKNQTARQLIEDLKTQGVFEEVGETGNGYPLLALDKDKLVEAYYDSVLFNLTNDVHVEAINNYEDGRKVVTDW